MAVGPVIETRVSVSVVKRLRIVEHFLSCRIAPARVPDLEPGKIGMLGQELSPSRPTIAVTLFIDRIQHHVLDALGKLGISARSPSIFEGSGSFSSPYVPTTTSSGASPSPGPT